MGLCASGASGETVRAFKGIVRGVAVGTVLWIVIIVACRAVLADEPGTAVYFPFANSPQLIIKSGAGVAWCSGCPENATQLGAQYYYACCTVCPDANDNRVAIIRPGWQWSSDCPSDYAGYIIGGNEQEFSSLTPGQMAVWLIDLRAEYPDAVLVCLNSYDLEYAADVLALLPPGTCEIIGVHIYDNVDVPSHLDALCPNCRYWITELGRCSSIRGADEQLYRMAREAILYGVEVTFLYTDINGISPCLDGIDSNGELTATGKAFKDAVTEEPYP